MPEKSQIIATVQQVLKAYMSLILPSHLDCDPFKANLEIRIAEKLAYTRDVVQVRSIATLSHFQLL